MCDCKGGDKDVLNVSGIEGPGVRRSMFVVVFNWIRTGFEKVVLTITGINWND